MDSTSFTFLATILILVLLSASLVLRSYILRRRYRLHFHQALTNGLFVDVDQDPFNATADQIDTLVGFRRATRRPGPKPVIWDVWTDTSKLPACPWSSVTPVAVRCAPSLSPSTLISSSQPSSGPAGSPPSLHPQSRSRSSFFSALRFPSVFSLSPHSSSSLPEAPRESSPSGSRSPPQSSSPNTSAPAEKSAATLSICVLVAMPDESAPVHRPLPDAKGKSVQLQPLESQRRDDADPLLPSALHLSSRPPHFTTGEDLPMLEFGVVEVRAGEWAWAASET